MFLPCLLCSSSIGGTLNPSLLVLVFSCGLEGSTNGSTAELRIPKDWQNHAVLTRRDDPDSFAQGLAQDGGGWKWDDTDSIALTLLNDDDQPTADSKDTSTVLSTRAEGNAGSTPEEDSGAHHWTSASRSRHYGEHLRRHAHGHH